MSKKRVKKFSGVYYRESARRRFKGKPDRCFYITFRDPSTGKMKWEKVGWESERYSATYARDIRGNRIQAIRHGEELPRRKKNKHTFGDIWKEYDKWLETSHTRPDIDRCRYRLHIKDHLETKLITQISPRDIERLMSDLIKKGLAPQTVKHCLALVRAVINKAVIWERWSGENPVSKVKLPSLDNKRERFLSREEAEELLAELAKRSQQVHDYSLMSLLTGMRAGELFALTWQDVDFDNGIVNVRGKKGVSRVAYMTHRVKKMLLRRHAKKSKSLLGMDFVFPSRDAEKTSEVSHVFDRTVEDLGWNKGVTDRRRKVVFYTLRHTFASWLAIQGKPLLAIKKLMGHSSVTMTERYSHLAEKNLRDVANSIEDEFDIVTGLDFPPKSIESRLP